jgi:hypothetical protein
VIALFHLTCFSLLASKDFKIILFSYLLTMGVPYRMKVMPYAQGALDITRARVAEQPQVIKFTSCFPMVGGSLRVFRFFHY